MQQCSKIEGKGCLASKDFSLRTVAGGRIKNVGKILTECIVQAHESLLTSSP